MPKERPADQAGLSTAENGPLSRGYLMRLCQVAARGKRGSPGVARFLVDIDAQVTALQDELARRSYAPGRGQAFHILDPKPRWIFALPFRDRVVQHLLIQESLAAIERYLPPQSYACRTGKGTHRCLVRAADLCRTRRFVLRIDFRKFFASIDHQFLRPMIHRLTPPPVRWLADRFLSAPVTIEHADFHFPGDSLLTPLERPHGLPIGSLTSQIWANVFLAPIDHLLASHLGIGTFVRYCDDMLVFDDDPGRLREALAAITDRATALRLRLHPQKTRLHRTSDPVSFLGFVLRRQDRGVSIRLRSDNITRMRQRIALVSALFAAGAIDLDEVTARVRAWLAHARHGHTRSLLSAELERLRFQREEH